MVSFPEYAPEISVVNSLRKNAPQLFIRTIKRLSLNGSCTSTHNDSEKFLLIEFISLLILYFKVLGIHIPTPPPRDNCYNLDFL